MLITLHNCALLLQLVSGCCRRGLLRRAGELVFSQNVRFVQIRPFRKSFLFRCSSLYKCVHWGSNRLLVTLGGGGLGSPTAHLTPHTYARSRKTISIYRCGAVPRNGSPVPIKLYFQKLCVVVVNSHYVSSYFTQLCDATGCDRLQLLRKRAARLAYGSPRLALSWRARWLDRFREAFLGLSLFLPSSSLFSLSSSPLFSFFSALVGCQRLQPHIFIRTPHLRIASHDIMS